MEATQLLLKIATILDKLQISYAITGGMAVSVWGRPRFTADIDIVVKLVEKNIPLLAKELLAIDKNSYVSEDAMAEALENQGEFNFIHPSIGLKVDFWIAKDDFNIKEIVESVPKNIDGCKVRFISPENLILSKLLWYKLSESTRQLEDVESVLRISKVDLGYIKKWAEIQETNDILEKIIKAIK